MNSSEFRQKLDQIKGTVIQKCKEAIESIAQNKYSLTNGYQEIVLIIPLLDPILGTPIYVNSCFQGEDNILIRMITCSPDGLSVGCHYVGEDRSWRARISDACMHERDLINILEIIEKMRFMENVFDFIHVKI